MGNNGVADRAEGWLDVVSGTVEEKVGQLIDNEQMELEGKAKVVGGKARKETAKAGQRLKGKVEVMKGQARQKINR